MLASLRSASSEPVSIENWNVVLRPMENSLAQLLRTRFVIESGPTDLEVFNLDGSLSTPFSSIFGTVMLDMFGIVESVSFVNTDWNCPTRVSALLLESDIRLLFCFSGDTPILSCFQHFTYFQKGLELLLSRPSWITELICLYSACLNSFLHSFWNFMYLSPLPLFFAFLWSLACNLEHVNKTSTRQGRILDL